MELGTHHHGKCFTDITGEHDDCVFVNAEGWAEFTTKEAGLAIWVGESTQGGIKQ